MRRIDKDVEVVLIQGVHRQRWCLGRGSAGHFATDVRVGTNKSQNVGLSGKLRGEGKGVVLGGEHVGVVSGAGYAVGSIFRSGIGRIVVGVGGFEGKRAVLVVDYKVGRQVIHRAGNPVGSGEAKVGLSGEGLQIH